MEDKNTGDMEDKTCGLCRLKLIGDFRHWPNRHSFLLERVYEKVWIRPSENTVLNFLILLVVKSARDAAIFTNSFMKAASCEFEYLILSHTRY
ncbi:Hypothetical predicted protein [Octopus vulgaris]|uniref:Uncharacterized protein n=1 Tax=Octopus vulgaris TaxID=6645 RepID=A0AA36FL90_OCTVU|nr:Hypothetical predicted protein [Octopus vulgaris]